MPRIHRSRSARGGFTLVDVCVSVGVLAIALGTLVGSVFWAMRLDEANEQTAAASQSVRAMLERMNAMPVEEVFAAYNQDRKDDPEPGRDYLGELSVDDPLLVVGKSAPPVVSVRFPDDAADQLAAGQLPITLRLEWQGSPGKCSLEMTTVLRNP